MLVVDKSPEKNKAAAATNPSVVITGSTRGLGFALAKEFLERGCRVTINGRTGESVDGALSRLNSAAVGERSGLGAEADRRMHGHPCDVSDAQQVQALWDGAVKRGGRVVNIIGDRPETVARFLAGKILGNRQNHAHFVWLTGAKVMGRFLIAPFRRRDLFADRQASEQHGR